VVFFFFFSHVTRNAVVVVVAFTQHRGCRCWQTGQGHQ
jgi:hypothetical protein